MKTRKITSLSEDIETFRSLGLGHVVTALEENVDLSITQNYLGEKALPGESDEQPTFSKFARRIKDITRKRADRANPKPAPKEKPIDFQDAAIRSRTRQRAIEKGRKLLAGGSARKEKKGLLSRLFSRKDR